MDSKVLIDAAEWVMSLWMLVAAIIVPLIMIIGVIRIFKINDEVDSIYSYHREKSWYQPVNNETKERSADAGKTISEGKN